MKSILLAAAVACAAVTPAYALTNPPSNDRAVAKNLTTGTSASCVTGVQAALISTQGSGSASIVVTGTWVGTLTFKAAADEKVTFNTVASYPQAGGASVTTATANGTWFVKAAGYRWVCVYFSAYTSGTAAVWLEASVAPVASFAGSDIATIGSAALALGQATGANSIPVVAASDVTAKIKGADAAGTPTAGTVLAIQGIASMTEVQVKGSGTAGTANAGVVSVQGIASMTPVQVDVTTLGGTAVAADGAAITGKPIPHAIKAVADAAAPTQVTAGQAGYTIGTLERIPIVTTRHPNHIQCQVAASTATTIQAVGGSCVAPGAGLSLYITDIDFATNAAGIAADSFNTLKTGTGGTCGTATAVVYQCMTVAATQATCVDHLITPIKLPANSELCWINSTAGSKTLNIQGYIAP